MTLGNSIQTAITAPVCLKTERVSCAHDNFGRSATSYGCSAAECAIQKPDGNLTRLSPPE